MDPQHAEKGIDLGAVLVVALDAKTSNIVLVKEMRRTQFGQTPHWKLPGGRIEPEDMHHADISVTAKTAAMRELREETRLMVSDALLLFKTFERGHPLSVFATAADFGGLGQRGLQGELVGQFPLNQLHSMCKGGRFLPEQVDILKRALKAVERMVRS